MEFRKYANNTRTNSNYVFAYYLFFCENLLSFDLRKGNFMLPPFTLSKYTSIDELNKDKAFYYEQLAKTFAANVKNDKLSDKDFRQFVLNSIPEFTED